jgi:uncharacterized protein YndB with AHSA1/START domain
VKWILIVVAVIVVVVAIVVAVGYSLPVAHTAQRSATFRAPPDAVWAAITDVGAYPAWRGDLTSVEQLPPVNGLPAWREVQKNDRITYNVTRSLPPTTMVARIADKGLPYGGEWEYQVAGEGSGTRVTITERGEVYNPVFRFVSRFIMGQTSTIDRYLEALGRKFGETTIPS